ncbi:unnamed protein product, partial [Owenia fusiformis]
KILDMESAEIFMKNAEPYVQIGLSYVEWARVSVNNWCKGHEAWQIILYTAAITIVLNWIHGFLFQPQKLSVRIRKSFFKFVRKLPIIRDKVQEEIEKTTKGIENGFNKDAGGMPYIKKLPPKGLSHDEVMKEIVKYKNMGALDWSKGVCSGTVYSGDKDLTELMCKVYGEFAWSNPLHPDVFPDIRKMEAEVAAMSCAAFNGGPEAGGTMTSGGTESIMLAVKAYRERAYDRGIKHPEIIAPITAHAAFNKSAELFGMILTSVPVDPKTYKVDMRAMKRAISRNTCMLVGSSPQFPHGVIDPIEEIAALGLKYDIPVHVDACLGGFLIPFMEKAGFPLPLFDFRVPGVTSISADTHKYGFAPKGSSVVLYNDKSMRKYQFFVYTDWPGGIYASPTLAGSRAGAIIAACWATMVSIGEEGYVDSTRKIIQTTRYITEKIRKINGLYVLGEPQVSVIAMGSLDFNIFRLSDALGREGWNLNALQFPASVHICCTLLHTKPGVADKFIADVTRVTAEIMKDPKAKCGGMGAIYGMAQSIPDRKLVGEIALGFIDACYSTKGAPVSNGTNGHAVQ